MKFVPTEKRNEGLFPTLYSRVRIEYIGESKHGNNFFQVKQKIMCEYFLGFIYFKVQFFFHQLGFRYSI